MTRAQEWPVLAVDVAAELRRQLDDSMAKRAELDRVIAARDERIAELERSIPALNAQIEELRTTLLAEAEELSEGDAPAEAKASRWWYAAWTNSNRRNAQLMLRIATLERWMREHGAESMRLQTALSVACEQIEQLTAQIAASVLAAHPEPAQAAREPGRPEYLSDRLKTQVVRDG